MDRGDNYNRGNTRGGGSYRGGGRGGGRSGGDIGGGRGGGRTAGGGGRGGGDQRYQSYQQQQYGRGGGGVGRGGGDGGGVQQNNHWGPQQQRAVPQQQLQQHYGDGSYGGRGRGSYGGGAGGGRGAPRQHSQPLQRLVPDMQILRITEHRPAPSCPKSAESNLLPVKRPDRGGTLTTKSPRLLANFFPVLFNTNIIIIHYDVDIKQEVPSKAGPSKMQKSYLRLIKEKLFSDYPSDFPLSQTTYDGEKNIYSVVELPTGKFTVDFSIAEDMRTSSYSVTIKEVNRLKLSKLKDYLEGKILVIPRDVLQGMDLVMKENLSRCRISAGRCFFPIENKREDDLKWGITASKGLQQSLKTTSQGLSLCLDYTVLAFRKKLSVLDFLLEHMGCRDVRDLIQLNWRDISRALKGVKVNVIHRVTKQKYSIVGLTDDSTRNTYFDAEDPERGSRRVSIVQYFREKYDREIVHRDLPSLDLGKNNRKNYVPMEFCVLVEGQRYPKEQLGKDGERLLKNMSLAQPHVRRNIISEMVQAGDGPCGDVSKNFELQVVKDMTKVDARVIGPPQLKVGAPHNFVKVDGEKCQWNLVGKSVVEGKSLERWALIDFSSKERNPEYKLDHVSFINDLKNRCQSLGMRMEDPLIYRATNMTPFENIETLHKLLEGVIKDAGEKDRQGRLQMIVCVMSRVDPGYKSLKWVSETKIGIVTQCCLSSPANKSRGRDQYLGNLAMKINAKLGGSNMELTHDFPVFPGEGPAMFIGADVNHPSQQNSSTSGARIDVPPSIAAVVGTINWPAANRYAARVCPQFGRKEKILNFGSMCKELVETYARLNKVRPQRIIIFRDGVSEGQFDMVLNEELFDLKKAIYDDHYRPTITVVVAQKRHQTRLFPLNREDAGQTGNIPPGTVVDTVITHPFEFDFYLCSHYGGIGTSKPTHYYVLYDDHNFTSDLLQKLIYDLCFTFARCTKPVSLVPPVYYADLVAYRGRMFQEVAAMVSPVSASSSRSAASTSSSSATSFIDAQPYKLHPELENIMFFV